MFHLLKCLIVPSLLLFSQEEVFVANGTLKPEEKSQDSRFGYALTEAPDLNHDNFTDLLVGAPLEDDHRGALYVYHGNGIHIIHNYKQVLVIAYDWISTCVSQVSAKLISISASFFISAYFRVITLPLPAVFWP